MSEGQQAATSSEMEVMAKGTKALISAARRADERGDEQERDQLLDEAEEQLGMMIEVMPLDGNYREGQAQR